MTDPSQSAREMVELADYAYRFEYADKSAFVVLPDGRAFIAFPDKDGRTRLPEQKFGKVDNRIPLLVGRAAKLRQDEIDRLRTVLAAQAAPGEPVAWRVKNDFGHWHPTCNRALADTWRDIERLDVEPLYAALVARPQDGCDPATIEALAADFENSVHHVWDKDEVAARIRSLASGGKVK